MDLQTKQSSLKVLSSKPTEGVGSVEISEISEKLAKQNALKALLALWGIGLLSAFLPIIHLVSVPFFFAAGFVAFFIVKKRRRKIVSANVPCPDCGSELPLSSLQLLESFDTICENCRIPLKISATA